MITNLRKATSCGAGEKEVLLPMKNVYFVQPSSMLNASVYLPYSVGCIAAYSFEKQDIKDTYKLCDFIFLKAPVDEVIPKIKNPYIIGFSCYMWNIDYNLTLAKAVKKLWPDCIIVFGGPQVPNDFEILEQNEFIDILIHGEGEITFYEMLKSLAENSDLQSVPNISFRGNSGLIRTQTVRYNSLKDFPSPYTTGMFDSIVNNPEYEGIQFDAVLETTRGCPYNNCVYCCWSGTKGAYRQFDTQRVMGDLYWIATHKICFCICADSNFGVFDRDEKLAEYVVELKNKYGYPQKIETIAAKNKSDLIFRINSKLESANLNRGISLAIQSFSEDVLKIVGRQNISFETFAKELERYRNSGIHTYTDLILGLPGDTLESFCKSLFDVIEAGQHDSININKCELLPNTKMYEKSFVEKYKIKTIRSNLCQNHSKVSESSLNSSRSELVVETSTMSMQDWKTAFIISICVQSFHSLGLLKFFAIYLRKAKKISYYDFYMNLYEWINSKSVFVKQSLDRVCESIDKFLARESSLHYVDSRFGDIYWDFQEALFLLCAIDVDKFYNEVKGYVKEYFTDEEIFDDLFNYQKEIIALPDQEDKEIETEYSWVEYFKNTFDAAYEQPEKKKCLLKIKGAAVSGYENYAKEIVWYGKRTGKTVNAATEKAL